MKAIFEFKTDDNANYGLLFQGAPSHFDTVDLTRFNGAGFNPAGLIVHDLIEHDFKRDTGSVEDEFKALGAAMYGRGNYGSITIDGLMNDIVGNARDCNLYLKPTLKGCKKFEDIEWQIEELNNAKLIQSIKNELDTENTKEVKEFIKLAFRYIRQGARKAAKRFKSGFNMFSMFDGMQREVLKVGKHLEEFEQLIIEFCFKNRSYKVYSESIYANEFDY